MSLFTRKTTPVTKKKNFRKDIQALRALAIASVVLYHLWPNRMMGGFAGVDIFFVISGYLMTISILRRLSPLAENSSITPKSITRLLADFYAHRIRRLVPAALTALVGTLFLAWISGNLDVLLTNAKNAISAATFWQNWYLANDSLNYLQQDNLIVATQHFWSLSLEEQFYLMWPLFLILGTLITLNVVIFYKKKRISGLILPISLATLASLIYGVWLTHSDQTVAYYSTPARVWELMIGGIIALLPVVKNYDIKLLMPYAGLVMCLYSVFFIGADNFPGWWALIPTIGTALIIYGGTTKPLSGFAFDHVFQWRPIQWLGNISYSVYLWHFPLIILLPIILHHDINGAHGSLFKVGIIIVSLFIAQISYMLVEQPTQKIRFKLRYIYLLFLLVTGIVVGLSFLAQKYSTTQLDKDMKAMHAAVLDSNNDCIGARAFLHLKKCGSPYGVKKKEFMNVGRDEKWGVPLQDNATDCYLFYLKAGENDTNRYCKVGDISSSKQIAVVGDSHAEQYVNTFNSIGLKYGYRVNMYTLGTCSTYAFTENSDTKTCQARLNFVLKSLNKNSFVIIASAFKNDTNIDKIVGSVKVNTIKPVLLINDEPRTTERNLSYCYTMGVTCINSRISSTKDITATLDRLVNDGLIAQKDVIDITSAFCDANSCYSSIGGIPVYYNTKGKGGDRLYNNSHITPSYSLTLAPLLEQKLIAHGYLQ